MSARPFAVGDRVVAYGRSGGQVGTGTGVIDKMDEIEADGDKYVSVWVRLDTPVMDDGVERKWITLYLDADRVTPQFDHTIALLPTDTSSGAVTQPNPAPLDVPTPDHGPLAGRLSDRPLAKVLSRPAHVPSLVALDREEMRTLLAEAIWHSTGGVGRLYDVGHTYAVDPFGAAEHILARFELREVTR
jgi:hypothetical protein